MTKKDYAELGYAYDSIPEQKKHGRRQKKDRDPNNIPFDFCPRCKQSVELYSRENLYNPSKIVRICSKCGMIRNSELWKRLSQQ